MNSFIVSAYQGCEIMISRTARNDRAASDCLRDHESHLLQPRSAFFADPPIDIRAKVFAAGGAYPVYGGKNNVGSDDNDLHPQERAFWIFSEEIRTLIEHRTQHNTK
jgi:hypothetical protein